MTDSPDPELFLDQSPRIRSVSLVNFLSYRSATLEIADFVAIVGPNASGKSNAVAALKLLRDIPILGLPAAISRRGGFDQLRHRSQGHPYDPSIRIDFSFGPDGSAGSGYYELSLKAAAGKKYSVKSEQAHVIIGDEESHFTQENGHVHTIDRFGLDTKDYEQDLRIPAGQSALTGVASFAAMRVQSVLTGIQTVEINTTAVRELQDTSSTEFFEPDGSNAVSIFEALTQSDREELVDELRAIVPGMDRIEVRRFADKATLAFYQSVGTKTRREFFAKQMSDGTLRAFAIILALLQPRRPSLVVVEEPEIAIHLGALRTLVEVLKQHAEDSQIMITTHSADIIDSFDIKSLRVVWSEKGNSRIANVAAHTVNNVVRGLISPGDLLRAGALDPA